MMKTKTTTAFLLALVSFALLPAPAARADEKGKPHDHEHDEKEKGPNGGLLVHAVEPHFEITVTKDRKAVITFLDDDNKPLAPAGQIITAVGGDRANPTRLAFAKGEEKLAASLVSDKPLPAGEHMELVLQIKTGPEAKPVTARVTLHLHGGDDHDH